MFGYRRFRRVRSIGVLVTFLALATAMYFFSREKYTKSVIDTRFSDTTFNSWQWINKYKIDFLTPNIDKTIHELDGTLHNMQGTKIIRELSNDAAIYVYQLKSSEIQALRDKISKLGTISNEKDYSDTSIVHINVEYEKLKLTSYRSELDELLKQKMLTVNQIQRKEVLSNLIEQSENKIKNYDNRDNVLFYTVARSYQKNISIFLRGKNFIVNFMIWLGLYLIGTIIIYYAAKILMLILALMGVKTNKLNGYSSYNNYRYRYNESQHSPYYAHKRKIKRIYHQKDHSNSGVEDDKNEEV